MEEGKYLGELAIHHYMTTLKKSTPRERQRCSNSTFVCPYIALFQDFSDITRQ